MTKERRTSHDGAGLEGKVPPTIAVARNEIIEVAFPSLPRRPMRVRVSSSGVAATEEEDAESEAKIWIEDKTTKAQWEATVTDANSHGPGGFPSREIFGLLNAALASLALAAEPRGEDNDSDGNAVTRIQGDGGVTTSLDGKMAKDNFILVLTLHVTRTWRPVYQFTLAPVVLNAVDVLDAKVRDTQEDIEKLFHARDEVIARLNEEIAALREAAARRQPAFLSLRPATQTTYGQRVQWQTGAQALLMTPPGHFTVSDDGTKISARIHGIYQVQCRLAQQNSGDGNALALFLNDSVYASCIQSDANRHQNTPQIFEVMELDESKTLSIQCMASYNSLNDPSNQYTHSRLTIVLLQSLLPEPA